MTYLFIGMLIGAIAGLVIGADCAMLYAAKQEVGMIQVPFFSRGTLMKNVIQPAQPRF